mgnify:FL=1
MAHREIDYSKMADKYESRYPGKNLRSFCYHEKIDYRQMLKELRSRTAERQEKENSESGHLYPLNVVNEVPSLVEEHFGSTNIKVTQHEVPIGEVPALVPSVTLTTGTKKVHVTLTDCPISVLLELLHSLEEEC